MLQVDASASVHARGNKTNPKSTETESDDPNPETKPGSQQQSFCNNHPIKKKNSWI